MTIVLPAVIGVIAATQKTNDPNYSDVSLLLHCNGTNGSTTFIDSSPLAQTVTAIGNAQISTAQSVFGGASALLDGSGDALSVPAGTPQNFGSGNLTFEWRQRFNSFRTTYNALFNNRGLSGGLNTGFISAYQTDGIVFFAWWDNAGTYHEVDFTSGGLSLNTWYYLTITRTGSTWKFFVNGSQVGGDQTESADIADSTTDMTIGKYGADPSWDSNCYFDETRITKVARSITGIPTAPFPNS